MIIRVVTFTDRGEDLAHNLFDNWQEMIPQYHDKEVPLRDWTGECFKLHLPILFIGACGIAVRTIAPFVQDKLQDSAVLVMDEAGEYVIPVLSGHMGGANSLAVRIASRLRATPVITTATDVEGVFSVDVFAKKQGLRIVHRSGIKKVSARLLRGEKVTVTWEDGFEGGTLPKGLVYVPEDTAYVGIRIVSEQGLANLGEKTQDILLVAREYVLGIGCKRDKWYKEIDAFVQENLPGITLDQVAGIATIDLKLRDANLWTFAQYRFLPITFYAAEELGRVPGDFTESEFVREVTGVSNVCERAALCLAGEGGELVLKKTAENGMTLAVAKRKIKLFGE